MIIVGCDYNPAFQQIAFVDTETGELQEQRLQRREEAEKFYRNLAAQGTKVRVGMEASGHARWFPGRTQGCSDSLRVESCSRLNLPVRDYLAEILPGFADLPIRHLAEFTPAAWVAQHSLTKANGA